MLYIRWFVNYSRFGAICKLESAQAVAPLRGHTDTNVCVLYAT